MSTNRNLSGVKNFSPYKVYGVLLSANSNNQNTKWKSCLLGFNSRCDQTTKLQGKRESEKLNLELFLAPVSLILT